MSNKRRMWLYITILLNVLAINANINIEIEAGQCTSDQCYDDKKFLFYDVNPPEGFNLRRDVYMRFAIMLSDARKRGKTNWNLVLPPWHRLYHWRSTNGKPTPWRAFFNTDTMNKYIPVTELEDLFSVSKNKKLKLDRVFVLKNYENAFENGDFREKWEIVGDYEECHHDYFWGYTNISVTEVICVKFQGKISKLWELIALHPKDKYVMFTHGEIPLHDNYGSKSYWDCRKSMKFNTELINAAKNYMNENFKCTEKCSNYAALHWRRQDFSHNRYKESPSIIGTVNQIDKALKKLNLKNIFIATDADSEFNSLIDEFSKFKYKVFYYTPTVEEIAEFQDGGVAIIDQIICSHSSYFVGTHESTFTFRIQEEREILGFPSNTTFNRLCPDVGICEKPSKWTVVN